VAEPYTFDDTVRIHDLAIWTWLGKLLVDYPKIENPLDAAIIIPEKKAHPIIRVKASPDRAFAKIVDTLVGQNWVPSETGQALRDKLDDNLAVLPLPAFSWQRLDPRPDPELSNVPFVYRKGFYDCEKKRYVFYRWPKTWLTDYTVTFWANREFSKAFFMEWFMSEFGNIGATIRETFIPVIHKEPWGEITARLQLTGDLSDLSELEGEEPRWVRSEFTVTLRTWVTMPEVLPDEIPGIADACGNADGTGIGIPIYYIEGEWKMDGVNELHPPQYKQSCNLWPGQNVIPPSLVCRLWTVEGDATVNTSDGKESLDIVVTAPADKAELFAIPLDLTDGYALVGFSFNYTSDAPVKFEVSTKDSQNSADTLSKAYVLDLPAAPQGKKFHQFFLVNEDLVFGKIVGIGPVTPQSINVSQFDLRYIVPFTPITIPTKIVGVDTRYEFYGLEDRPYFVVVKLTSTPGPVTFTLDNDLTVPSFSRTLAVDSANFVAGAGVVMMNQPKVADMVLRFPNAVAVSQVYLIPYDGHYNGHTI
jgi:hypothetical protein